MRSICFAILLSVVPVTAVGAGDLRNFDDAALHAVQFLSQHEGWAVGDDGVILHTINGGRTWDRRPTGVRASLRSVQFINFHTGWAVGREELPHGARSVGVMLFTRDGGIKWQPVHMNALPGLNCVRFIDEKIGFVAGDATDQYPTGIFQTLDGGRTWKPLPGPRCTSWLSASSPEKASDQLTGGQSPPALAVAGAWNRLGTVRDGKLAVGIASGAEASASHGGRNLRSICLGRTSGVAVGQKGLMLCRDETASAWSAADLKLPSAVQLAWDFHTVACVGAHTWTAGRPGSAILHSGDRGRTWEIQRTGQPLPINNLCFLDEQRGWAVGEFGLILATQDGGKSWQVQRRGGQRAAILFVHARGTGLPVDSMALLGGEQGYLTAALRITTSDPASAALNRSSEAQRWTAAVRMAGGGAGETLWQFPLPQHLVRSAYLAGTSGERDAKTRGCDDLLKWWDKLHGARAREELLRQMVLAIRIWQPDVVITDHPDIAVTSCPAEAIVARAVHQAFQQAADPACFPEQIDRLGLKPWQPVKLYGCWERPSDAQVVQSLLEPSRRLEAAPRDFAMPALALLSDVHMLLPGQRYFRLLDHRQGRGEVAVGGYLMGGILPSPAGMTQRRDTPVPELPAETIRAIRASHSLQALAELPVTGLTDPDRLAQLGPALRGLPDRQAAPLAFAVANQFVRRGQWDLARENYLMMLDQYQAHPLTADACCWLMRHASSSEARQRHERGQFLVVTESELRPGEADKGNSQPALRLLKDQKRADLSNGEKKSQWYQRALQLESRLSALGNIYSAEPSLQFCVQSARRNVRDLEGARKWYAQYAESHPEKSPWRDAALAESWLARRRGPCPKPSVVCRTTSRPPYLDGKLDDDCWQAAPVVLSGAVGESCQDHKTEAWLAFDDRYLYLAVRCRHPADRYVKPVAVRPRDADVRPYDRIELLLGLDRNYSTYYRLQIDQRGCVCDDCWGDLSWNPRWHVAVKSDETCWQAEAAIPLAELTGDSVQPGTVWAANIVRVLPGRGVQALSLPGERGLADVEPRPEGMGLLFFIQDPRPARGAAGSGR